jgi:hypothetical protein
MPPIVEPTSTNDAPEAQRAVIKLALNDIVSDVEIELRLACLNFPVFLTVPNSGDSVASLACPLDPLGAEWSRATTIACRIIGQRLGDVRLRGRPLHCAVANGTIAATDVTADAEGEE